MKNNGFQKDRRSHTVLTVVFTIIAIAYLYPIFFVLVNSLKSNAAINLDTFAFPTSGTFMGLQNYIKGMTFGNYPFYRSVEYSLMITLLSSALILICTSMAAWYISRVDSLICRVVYYLCVFSMVVPFQMVMFTLAKTADTLKLNRPWTIPIIYLGFGAGLAVFMFTGFVKSIPRSIEEAAVIDGCNPVQTFFQVVLPMMKPTFISVGVLEIMWVWNDYLLPYLVLDINEFRTIPIHIQYLKGSYGSVEMGATMALILMNSLKTERAITTTHAFELPNAETFVGLKNYIYGIQEMDFLSSFWYSLVITVSSVALILLCCSMCAWYITRVQGVLGKGMYYLCVFSMIVPFQMVMFTLAKTADTLKLNNPYNICIIYLGFGAGLAVFMFTGFVKSMPIAIEEAAMIDGCNPIQIFFKVVCPILKPTMISTAILETMWVWNDYLLPTLVLDIKTYRTIPMAIQYFRGSYGKVEMAPMMACIMITVLPVIVLYLICQKYIIDGVVAGAVKG